MTVLQFWNQIIPSCFLKRLATQGHGRPTWNATQPIRGHGEKFIITIGKMRFRNLTSMHVSRCSRFWQLHLSGEKHQCRMKRLFSQGRQLMSDLGYSKTDCSVKEDNLCPTSATLKQPFRWRLSRFQPLSCLRC